MSSASLYGGAHLCLKEQLKGTLLSGGLPKDGDAGPKKSTARGVWCWSQAPLCPYPPYLIPCTNRHTDTCSLSSGALVSPAWALPTSKSPFHIALQRRRSEANRMKVQTSSSSYLCPFVVVVFLSYGCNFAKFLKLQEQIKWQTGRSSHWTSV